MTTRHIPLSDEQKREVNKACDAANEVIPYPEVELKSRSQMKRVHANDLNALIEEIERLRAELEKTKKEMISRKALAAIMEPTVNDISEANEWVNRILSFERAYNYPKNFSYEEAERIVLDFLSASVRRMKELGHNTQIDKALHGGKVGQ